MTKLESLRADATLLMAEIRPLAGKLAELRAQHANVAQQLEAESRKQAVIRTMPYGASKGKRQTKPSKPNQLMAMFKNMTTEQQAQMLAMTKEAAS